MKLVKRLLILPAIFVFLISPSHAQDSIFVNVKFSISKYNTLYESTGTAGQFASRSYQVKVKMQFYLIGSFGKLLLGEEEIECPSATSEKEACLSFTNVAKNYLNVELINVDGKIYMVESFEEDTELGTAVISKEKTEVKLTEGTWVDYQNGGDVTLKPMEHESKVLMEVLEESMAIMVNDLESAGTPIVESNFGEITIKANLSKMEFQISGMDVNATFPVKLESKVIKSEQNK